MINLERLGLLYGTPKTIKSHEWRRATRLELYFDLFFVAAIGIVAHTFAHHVGDHWTWMYFFQFVVQVTAVRWIWSSITYFFERFEATWLTKRTFFLIQMFLIAWMALVVDEGLLVMGKWFFGLYGLSKLLLASLFYLARKNLPKEQRFVDTLNIGANLIAFLGGCIWFFVWPVTRIFVFLIALWLDIFLPLLHKKRAEGLPAFGKEKFSERVGLFVIIVLGESILSVITWIDTTALSTEMLRAWAWCLFLSFWHRWMYFDGVSRATIKDKYLYCRAYLHLPLIIAYVALWALLLVVLEHIGESYHVAMQWVIVIAAVIMCLIGILERIVHNHAVGYERNRVSTIHILISIAGMLLLLIPWWLSICLQIWLLVFFVFYPIGVRIMRRLTDTDALE